MSERLARVEAQEPHTNKALLRIETSVERLNGHLSKGVWIVLALFITAVFGLIRNGSIPL